MGWKLFLVLIVAVSGSVFADHSGETLFDARLYVTESNANGCGTGWNKKAVRDKWGNANFKNACNDHDDCYEDCNEDKDTCDENFKAGMRKACKRAYNSAWHTAQKTNCYAVAEAYYRAVRNLGNSAYKEAQKAGGCR